MNKMLALILLLSISSGAFAQQVIGKVDKKTKEFSIAAGQTGTYMVFGYQFANATTQKWICFASSEDVVRANHNLKLGSYFDTDRMPSGYKITYLGVAGTFGRMRLTTGAGTMVIFYLPKTCYVIK